MNRYRHLSSRSRGFVLIEAMIALVVLSFGIVSIAKLQSELLASSGYTKARAEAVQLAERKMEELRNMIVEGDYTDIETGSDTPPGVNAAFTRTWTITPGTAPVRKHITLTIAWTDPKEGAQAIILNSTIAWDDPTSAVPEASELDEGAGGTPPPTGAARIGGDNDYSDGIPDDAVLDETTSLYRLTHLDEEGNVISEEIIRGDGTVLLTCDGPCSSIAGTVYIQTDSSGDIYLKKQNETNDAYARENIWVTAPRQCWRSIGTPSVPLGTLDVWPANATGGVIKYRSFDYKCYVGADWARQIGIEKIDGALQKDRVCQGDPTVAYSAVAASRHPMLSPYRQYRGHEQIDGIWYLSNRGIGMLSGAYTAKHYAGHNFLLMEQANVGSGDTGALTACKNAMEVTTPSPFAAPTGSHVLGGEGYHASHPARFFCLSPTCPNDLPLGEPPMTTIKLTITRLNAGGNRRGQIEEDSVVINNENCPRISGGGNNNDPYIHECYIDWRGSIGTIWTGEVVITPVATHTVCNYLTGDEEDMAFIENFTGAGTSADPKVIAFTGVTTNTVDTGIELTLKVKHPDSSDAECTPNWP